MGPGAGRASDGEGLPPAPCSTICHVLLLCRLFLPPSMLTPHPTPPPPSTPSPGCLAPAHHPELCQPQSAARASLTPAQGHWGGQRGWCRANPVSKGKRFPHLLPLHAFTEGKQDPSPRSPHPCWSHRDCEHWQGVNVPWRVWPWPGDIGCLARHWCWHRDTGVCPASLHQLPSPAVTIHPEPGTLQESSPAGSGDTQ